MAAIVMQFPQFPCTAPCYGNSKITVVDKGKKRLRIGFLCGKTEMFLYLTFPSCGGVRIRNDNSGFFSCDELFDISYNEIGENELHLKSSDNSAVFKYDSRGWSFRVQLSSGEEFTVDNENLLFSYDLDGEFKSVYFILPYENEEVFGFGEKFNSFKQDKIDLLLWNLDCCDGLPFSSLSNDLGEKPQSYKNVPIVYSTKGYTLFFNTFFPIHASIGALERDKMYFHIFENQFDIYLFTKSAQENLNSYLKLTGKPFLPPKWAFNYWDGAGTNIWNCPDREHAYENVVNVLDEYAKNGIPVHATYLEIKPNKKIFDEVAKRNIKLLMWTNSQLPKSENSTFDYDSVLIKKNSDKSQNMPLDYIDFTSPKSIDAICDKLAEQWDAGQQGMMIDYADSMPEDSYCSNGKTGREMHNFYPYWYAMRMNWAFTERMDKDFILFQRSGCAGSQHYTAQFGGDMRSSFLGLERSVHAALSAASSGFSVWGSDLGGFFFNNTDVPDREIYMRWTQFSTFCPLMRNHGLNKHWPWTHGEEALENFKFYDAIRISMLDFIYSDAVKCSLVGDTMIKSMAVAYGLSPSVETQYLFCDTLMIAPIFESGKTETAVDFHTDGWRDLYTGKRYGRGSYTADAPTERIPVFIRDGAVIPLRLHNETLMPTLDENNLCKAILITLPESSAVREIYLEENNYSSAKVTLKRDIDKVTVCFEEVPDCYQTIIVYGDTSVLPDCAFQKDLKNNRLIIERNSDVKQIKLNLKGTDQ